MWWREIHGGMATRMSLRLGLHLLMWGFPCCSIFWCLPVISPQMLTFCSQHAQLILFFWLLTRSKYTTGQITSSLKSLSIVIMKTIFQHPVVSELYLIVLLLGMWGFHIWFVAICGKNSILLDSIQEPVDKGLHGQQWDSACVWHCSGRWSETPDSTVPPATLITTV